MTWVYVYLAIGLLNALWILPRQVRELRSSRYISYTLLHRDRPHEHVDAPHPILKRDVAEHALESVIYVLLWPAQLVFRLVFIPVHDALAKRAWEKNPPAWKDMP